MAAYSLALREFHIRRAFRLTETPKGSVEKGIQYLQNRRELLTEIEFRETLDALERLASR
jgi:hypothetical protein